MDEVDYKELFEKSVAKVEELKKEITRLQNLVGTLQDVIKVTRDDLLKLIGEQ